MADIEFLKSHLGVHPDFPKKGIVFQDFLPILRSPLAFETLLTHFLNHITTTVIPRIPADAPSRKIDAIVGLDARGFLIGPPLALRLGAAFVPVRKRGKLPGECVQAIYAKEYGEDVFEMQANSIQPGQIVLVVDDLIATGGSAKAAGELVAKQGGKTVGYIFVIGLPFLKGHERLDAPAYSIIQADD
ncbi:hypothetical protein M0805_005359 [Coniferiporia weirii]|nr:hypothetical protein M0805_005359 [Coniferiporia weirii]